MRCFSSYYLTCQQTGSAGVGFESRTRAPRHRSPPGRVQQANRARDSVLSRSNNSRRKYYHYVCCSACQEKQRFPPLGSARSSPRVYFFLSSVGRILVHTPPVPSAARLIFARKTATFSPFLRGGAVAVQLSQDDVGVLLSSQNRRRIKMGGEGEQIFRSGDFSKVRIRVSEFSRDDQ